MQSRENRGLKRWKARRRRSPLRLRNSLDSQKDMHRFLPGWEGAGKGAPLGSHNRIVLQLTPFWPNLIPPIDHFLGFMKV